ncbi:MAG: hypothetical protein PHU51_00585 [Candidatus Nanoarchaeia archaeon]|nr:hypothetical protein [Candidatus Nanoarchaeia archaeon]
METKKIVALLTILLFAIVISALVPKLNSITGFVTHQTQTGTIIPLNTNYQTESNLTEQINTYSNIDSLKISGSAEGSGEIKIYLQNGDQKILVYYENLDSNNQLTGKVTDNSNGKGKSQEHIPENTTEEIAEEEIPPESTETPIEEIAEEVNTTEENQTLPTTNETEQSTNTTIPVEEEILSEENLTLPIENTTEPIEEELINTTIPVEEENTTEETPEENITPPIIPTEEIFSNYCFESCSLDPTKTYNLIVELEGNLSLNLDSLTITEPIIIEQTTQFENIQMEEKEELTLNLNNYFTSSNQIYYDTSSTFKVSQIKDNLLILRAQKQGTYQMEIIATDGETLVRSNKFYITVGTENITEPIINTTEQFTTFIPWLEQYNTCEKTNTSLCCFDTQTYTQNQKLKIKNTEYICSINENSNDWIQIDDAFIIETLTDILFLIDQQGNSWLKGTLCQTNQSCQTKFTIPELNFILTKTGNLQIQQIEENVNQFNNCENCLNIKNNQDQIVAQIIQNTLKLKGKFYQQQIDQNSCEVC